MTFLNIMNNVLRRLRESTVTTVNQTTYSTMTGDYINDAARQVEMAWDWSMLRSIKTVTTESGTKLYEIPSSGVDVEILTSYNDTSNGALRYQPQSKFDRRTYTGNALTGSPTEYTVRGVANGNTQIEVYPTPDGIYDLQFNCVVRQGQLTADVDELLVPEWPVIHLAVAMLARERGEVGGKMAMEYFMTADRELADAISKDAGKHPDELVYETGYVWRNNAGAYN